MSRDQGSQSQTGPDFQHRRHLSADSSGSLHCVPSQHWMSFGNWSSCWTDQTGVQKLAIVCADGCGRSRGRALGRPRGGRFYGSTVALKPTHAFWEADYSGQCISADPLQAEVMFWSQIDIWLEIWVPILYMREKLVRQGSQSSPQACHH